MEQLTKQGAAPSVPKGYKQTEVGVIPEDWEVVEFSEIGEAIIGLTYSPSDVNSSGKLVHRSSNIQNNQLAYDDNVYVTCNVPDKLILKKNDILICVRNGSRNLIGKSAIIKGQSVGETFGAFMSVFRTNGYAPLIYQCFISNIVQSQINASLGATINQITNKTLNSFQTPLPPTLTEQKAIATALSEVDELINSLDQLLTKKQAIKQGAMQELLTPPHKGGRRLPGFSGEWVEKKLGEVSHIKTGSRNNQDKIEDGEYPFYVRSQTVERINTYSYNEEAILIPGEGGIGTIFHYINGKFEVHQRVYKISSFYEGVLGKFIFLKMQHEFYAHAMTNSVKATVDSLRLPTFQEFQIYLPPTLAEQKAIASVLSDMDQEIEQLESKKAKYQHLKQGMMQELLTGKIRLV